VSASIRTGNLPPIAALAGFILVYLGALATAFAGFPKEDRRAVRPSSRYRAWFALIGILFCVFACGFAALAKWQASDVVAGFSLFSFLPRVLGRHFGRAACIGDRITALTLDKEQKLEGAELIAFFESDEAMWQELAKKAYEFVEGISRLTLR
jgi:hypothetical protein